MNDQSRASARQTGLALEAHYQFILWLVPTLERFPLSSSDAEQDKVEYVIKPQFDGVRSFSEGLVAVKIGDRWGSAW